MKSFSLLAVVIVMALVWLSCGEGIGPLSPMSDQGVQPSGKPHFLSATVTKGSRNPAVTIPVHAVQVADNVFDLGHAVDVDGTPVQGFMIIHPKDGFAKPSGSPGGGKKDKGGGGGESTCFAFMAKGAKWKTVEPWIVNPTNTTGLSGSFVFSNLGADIQKWEDASGINILGDGSSTTATLVADTQSPDDNNEVYFADVSSSGAIAVTIVWGVFGGPPFNRRLVEWDQVYDDVDFDWSAAGEAGKMDFENIASHEIGHALGMGHPSDDCTEETMYRFAGTGEIKKRDLNAGDIAGINELY